MSSPLTLINTFELFESIFICLFPLALVSSITFSGILIYLGSVVFALLLILKRKQYFNDVIGFPWHVSAFLFYVFAFSITRLINSGLTDALHSFLNACQNYFVFLWPYYYIFGCNKKNNLLRIFLLIAAFISIAYGVMQFFHLDFLNRQVVLNRLSGFHKNPYSYAGQLIVFFFFIITCYLNETSKHKRHLFFLISMLAFFCILNTSERAVIFGVVISLAIYLLLQINKKDLDKVFLIILVPFVATWFLNRKVFYRIKNVFLGQKQNVRFKLWDIAFNLWKRNILFGLGKFPPVYQEIDNSLHVLVHAHNVYLQILVTHGLLGLVAFLNLFFSVFRIIFKNLKSNPYSLCLLAVIVAFFVEGYFEHFWGDSEVRYLLLYFIGYVCGILDFNLKKEYNDRDAL